MDVVENRNLLGARRTLDEAFQLSKDSLAPGRTHLENALKLFEHVLSFGEAKRKTSVEKLQMVLEGLET
jgi:hypothetical protein